MFAEGGESCSEGVFSVELPDSSEVGLVGDCWLHFMGVYHVLFGEKLRGDLTESFPFLLEFLSTFLGGGVNTEYEFVLLVGVGE